MEWKVESYTITLGGNQHPIGGTQICPAQIKLTSASVNNRPGADRYQCTVSFLPDGSTAVPNQNYPMDLFDPSAPPFSGEATYLTTINAYVSQITAYLSTLSSPGDVYVSFDPSKPQDNHIYVNLSKNSPTPYMGHLETELLHLLQHRTELPLKRKRSIRKTKRAKKTRS